VAQLGSASGNDLHRGAGKAVSKQRRGGLVDFDGSEPAYLVAQPVGGSSGARADLEHVRAEINVTRQDGQDVGLNVLSPFRARANSRMVGVHDHEITDGNAGRPRA